MTEDLAAIYDTDEFAVLATRSRLLADDVTFAAIPGVVDGDALDGHVVAARRRLQYPTGPDVVDGDVVTIDATGPMAIYSGRYRVIQPERINDGLETHCLLQRIADQA